MEAGRVQRYDYLTVPMAGGTARLYSLECAAGIRHELPLWNDGYARIVALSPGLWVVRNVSACEVAAHIAISRPHEALTVTGGVVRNPRAMLADPVWSLVAESAGRPTSMEIDVDGDGADLHGVSSGPGVKAHILITLIARRTTGEGNADRETR